MPCSARSQKGSMWRSGSETSAIRTPGRSPGSSRSRRRPSTSTDRVAATVLAAGASTRCGGVKQHDLLPAVLAALGETSVDDVVVVEGAHVLEAAGVRVVPCPD